MYGTRIVSLSDVGTSIALLRHLMFIESITGYAVKKAVKNFFNGFLGLAFLLTLL